MSELVPSEIIERLEQRHEKLIRELDALNSRLEQALNGFTRSGEPTDQADQEHSPASQPIAAPKAAGRQASENLSHS